MALVCPAKLAPLPRCGLGTRGTKRTESTVGVSRSELLQSCSLPLTCLPSIHPVSVFFNWIRLWGSGQPSDWLGFLDEDLPDLPVKAMEREFESIRRKLKGVEEDTNSPDTRLSDNTLQFNTANATCLTQLMMGALTSRYGEPLHARVRYSAPTLSSDRSHLLR
jgi:hypothetical protein